MASSCKNISNSSSDDDGDQLRRGPWTLEEDTLLVHYIACHGEGRWNSLAKEAGLRRTGKSCRLRWLNYLKPDVKRGNLTPQEQLLILELHFKWGNRWSKIAQHLPGRTDNEIKNYWRTRVQKQARLLKVDVSSAAFQDVIRCFWMPRLLQKIKESSSPAVSQPLNCAYDQILGSSQVVPYPGEVIQSSDSSTNSGFSSQASQITETHGITDNINDQNVFAMSKDYCFGDNCSYDMDGLNMVTPTSDLQGFGNPVGNFDMAEINWFNNGLSDGLWNMEEL